jgi:hypothetical protein
MNIRFVKLTLCNAVNLEFDKETKFFYYSDDKLNFYMGHLGMSAVWK